MIASICGDQFQHTIFTFSACANALMKISAVISLLQKMQDDFFKGKACSD